MQVTDKVERLSSDNYDTWSIVLESILRSRNLWSYCEIPDDYKTDEELTPELEIKHEEAKAIIYTSIERKELLQTGVCIKAWELWNKIKENHEGSNDQQQNLALQDFLSFKYIKGESLIEYCGRFECALARLESTGEEVKINVMFFIFRQSLPKEYKDYITYWMIANKDGRISQLISSLKIHFFNEKLDQEPESVAFYGRAEQDEEQEDEEEEEPIICSYCKKEGHFSKYCFKRRNDKQNNKISGRAKHHHDDDDDENEYDHANYNRKRHGNNSDRNPHNIALIAHMNGHLET